jgi:hypothetical protein
VISAFGGPSKQAAKVAALEAEPGAARATSRAHVQRWRSQARGTVITRVTAKRTGMDPVKTRHCNTDADATSITITWSKKTS